MRKLLTLLFTMCCAISFAQLDNAQLGMSIKGSQTLPSTITVTSSETLAVGDPVFIDVTIDSTSRPAEPGFDVTNGVVAISNDGSSIIYGLGSYLRVYGWNGMQYMNIFAMPYDCKNVVMSSDGSICAANSLTHATSKVFYRRNNALYGFTVAPNASAPMVLAADGNRLVYATDGLSGNPGIMTLVWTGAALVQGNSPDTDYDQITTMALTPDGEYLVCGRSAVPYLVTYKWDAVDSRYELMTAPDTIATGIVQSVTLSDDGQILYVAQPSTGSSLKIRRYDYSAINGRYELGSAASPNYAYLTKIKAFGHGRRLFALYRSSGGTNYTVREINGTSLSVDTNAKIMASYGTNAIFDFALATDENDYAYYAIASYYRLGAAEVYPKFTAVKADSIAQTGAINLDLIGLPETFDWACGYITDSSLQFGSSAKIILNNPALAPYLE